MQRTVQRTAELMKQHDTEDIWPYGGIPLNVIQKYLNFHYSVSLDLFGSETSSNVAGYYAAGLKGRWMETRRKDDHVLTDYTMDIPVVENGQHVVAVHALGRGNVDLDPVVEAEEPHDALAMPEQRVERREQRRAARGRAPAAGGGQGLQVALERVPAAALPLDRDLAHCGDPVGHLRPGEAFGEDDAQRTRRSRRRRRRWLLTRPVLARARSHPGGDPHAGEHEHHRREPRGGPSAHVAASSRAR